MKINISKKKKKKVKKKHSYHDCYLRVVIVRNPIGPSAQGANAKP